MDQPYYIQLSLTGLAIFAGYLLAYFQQKGKDNAQRNVIDEFTRIVEASKHDFVKQAEKFKSELSVLTNKQNVLFSEIKNATVEFYSNLNKWVWHCSAFFPAEYNYTNYLTLSEKSLSLTAEWHETNISFGKIQLLSDDVVLTDAAHNAIMAALHFHNLITGAIAELKLILPFDKAFMDSMFPKEGERQPMSPAIESFQRNMLDDNSKRTKELVSRFQKDRSEIFENSMNTRNIFRDLAKNYLLK